MLDFSPPGTAPFNLSINMGADYERRLFIAAFGSPGLLKNAILQALRNNLELEGLDSDAWSACLRLFAADAVPKHRLLRPDPLVDPAQNGRTYRLHRSVSAAEEIAVRMATKLSSPTTPMMVPVVIKRRVPARKPTDKRANVVDLWTGRKRFFDDHDCA